jgi:hypothetical protein
MAGDARNVATSAATHDDEGSGMTTALNVRSWCRHNALMGRAVEGKP